MALSACQKADSKRSDTVLVSPYNYAANHFYGPMEPSVYADAFIPEKTDSCPSPPLEPLKDLQFNSVYRRDDPTRSKVDVKEKEEYVRQTRNLRLFQNQMIIMANRSFLHGKSADIHANCVLDWLYEWANNDAFLGVANGQGRFIRQWSSSTFAISYLQIRPAIDPKNDKHIRNKTQVIEAWLLKIAARIKERYPDNIVDVVSSSYLNNHLYWGAWAVMAVALATDTPENFTWAVERAKYALQVQVQENGTLDLEMKRGKKALQYHIFSLGPLVMLAEVATLNGEDLYKLNNRAISRLVGNVLQALHEPDDNIFTQSTSLTQDDALQYSDEHFAWMEVYNKRYPEPAIDDFLKTKRPIFNRRFGGNMSVLFNP